MMNGIIRKIFDPILYNVVVSFCFFDIVGRDVFDVTLAVEDLPSSSSSSIFYVFILNLLSFEGFLFLKKFSESSL